MPTAIGANDRIATTVAGRPGPQQGMRSTRPSEDRRGWEAPSPTAARGQRSLISLHPRSVRRILWTAERRHARSRARTLPKRRSAATRYGLSVSRSEVPGGSSVENQIVRDHLRRWAEELVDLTRRNRLLFFRHTASASFEFAQSASEVERGLGRTWGFHLPAPPPADPEVEVAAERPLPDALVVDMTPARDAVKIERGLKNLASKAQSEFLDSGIWVLYLGLGRLSWSDIDGKHASSPLLLVPVNLVQAGAGATRAELERLVETSLKLWPGR